MLQELVPGIWHAEGDVYMTGGIHFPVRMVVIRLSDGKLLLHSPIAIDDELEGELRALGEVGYMIAPNLLHHLFVKKALARFPDAKLYGAPGFDKKRPDLNFDDSLDKTKPFPWSKDLEHVLIKGVPQINETAFYHGATGSLIVTDLVFNIRKRHNFQTDLMHRMVGVYRKLAQSRLWRMVVKDKAAMRESAGKLLGWEAKRLIMAHGEIFEGDVNAELRRSMAWLGKLGTEE